MSLIVFYLYLNYRNSVQAGTLPKKIKVLNLIIEHFFLVEIHFKTEEPNKVEEKRTSRSLLNELRKNPLRTRRFELVLYNFQSRLIMNRKKNSPKFCILPLFFCLTKESIKFVLTAGRFKSWVFTDLNKKNLVQFLSLFFRPILLMRSIF